MGPWSETRQSLPMLYLSMYGSHNLAVSVTLKVSQTSCVLF